MFKEENFCRPKKRTKFWPLICFLSCTGNSLIWCDKISIKKAGFQQNVLKTSVFRNWGDSLIFKHISVEIIECFKDLKWSMNDFQFDWSGRIPLPFVLSSHGSIKDRYFSLPLHSYFKVDFSNQDSCQIGCWCNNSIILYQGNNILAQFFNQFMHIRPTYYPKKYYYEKNMP